jgi:hypothetical protein
MRRIAWAYLRPAGHEAGETPALRFMVLPRHVKTP